MIVVVRSCGDVGSAVAHVLFSSGRAVVIHDLPRPAHMRRAFAFADALFEGRAELEGVIAKRISDIESLAYTLRCRQAISVSTAPWEELVATVKPDVIVDARMRKREVPRSAARAGCHLPSASDRTSRLARTCMSLSKPRGVNTSATSSGAGLPKNLPEGRGHSETWGASGSCIRPSPELSIRTSTLGMPLTLEIWSAALMTSRFVRRSEAEFAG